MKRQHWKEHCQVDVSEQVMDDKPWENEALQELEEAFPPMRAEESKKEQQTVLRQTQGLKQMAIIPKCLEISAQRRAGELWYCWQKWSNVDVGQCKPAHFSSF